MNKLHWVNNRRALTETLPKNASAVLIVGNSSISRNSDVTFAFRQDSNILYLGGYNRPGTALLADVISGKWYVVLPNISKVEETFDDHRGCDDFVESAGLEGYISSVDALAIISKNAKLGDIYMNSAPPKKSHGVYANPLRSEWKTRLRRLGITIKDVRPMLAQLRMLKQPYEINLLQKAINQTKIALDTVTKNPEELLRKTELQLANEITAHFYSQNVEHAYQPIIASSKNAAVLHHHPDASRVINNQVLLFDVGAEYNGYAADISRTVIIGENNNLENIIKDIQIVQSELISALRPGVEWKYLQTEAVRMLEDVAKKHELLKINNIKELFPHAIGHFLGLDVHDAGDYSIPLQENMVITIEPGLYSQLLGFGIRVEDDILITKTGAKIL